MTIRSKFTYKRVPCPENFEPKDQWNEWHVLCDGNLFTSKPTEAEAKWSAEYMQSKEDELTPDEKIESLQVEIRNLVRVLTNAVNEADFNLSLCKPGSNYSFAMTNEAKMLLKNYNQETRVDCGKALACKTTRAIHRMKVFYLVRDLMDGSVCVDFYRTEEAAQKDIDDDLESGNIYGGYFPCEYEINSFEIPDGPTTIEFVEDNPEE